LLERWIVEKGGMRNEISNIKKKRKKVGEGWNELEKKQKSWKKERESPKEARRGTSNIGKLVNFFCETI
jgi:hypothetical protein